MNKVIYFILLLIACCAHINASEAAARIDIDGRKSKISLKPEESMDGVICSNPPWVKDKQKKETYIYSKSKALRSAEWEDYQISFTPEDDGEITIMLRGPWEKGKDGKQLPVWVYFDNIEVHGAELINGDFEESISLKEPKGWKITKGAEYINSDNGKYIKVWCNAPVRQTIKVNAGQTVTVKAMVKKVN